MLHRRISLALPGACAAFTLLTSALPAHAMSPRDEPSEDKPTPPVDPEKGEEEYFSIHFQSTMATAYHPSFSAKYTGKNSMSPDSESATAFVSTLYADQRLWPGCEFLFDPEMSGGKGLSSTLGVAAFPTGIVYRVGDPAPAAYVARVALSQTFELGGGRVTNEAGPNELAGTRDRDVFAITVGKVSVTDVFDGNRYAHDATERFFDWALFASGAWDYPADTKGYTWGVLADLAVDWWSARAGIALEPKRANEADMDWRVGKAHGLMAEYEARYNVSGQHGALSTLVFLNQERAGSYAQVLADPARYHNDVTETRADGRVKYGIALSLEQQIRPGLGTFLRMSANDGKTESWAFTEIDRSIATGVVQDGALWHRDRDEAGAAVVLNGLSPEHRAYLQGGGYGFIIGDGALNYGLETLFDIYYKLSLQDNVSLTGFYQPIINPGYNKDRGPVHVFTGRLHIAF
ncbi:MAG TPA: carbohydrate porin [Polyangiaceae bacterium]|jgi:high affinity Mn2+ porin|nr:carbohydrate porin [Polyangiaceae bacterium]